MTFDTLVDWLSTTAPTNEPCGLFGVSGTPVPLKARDVKATVYTVGSSAFADTTETLSYVAGSEDCTATFKFPLPPKSSVYKFKAMMADKEVVTEVKPKAQAEEEYRLATQQGHGAVIMKQEPSASMFTIEVGNLEAHTECVVEFSYLRLLDSFSGAVEFVHTATWVPPYVGSAGDVQAGLQKVEAEAPSFANKVSYTLSYDVTVRSEIGAIKSVECPEDHAKVQHDASGRTAHVQLSHSEASPSRDFTLLVELDTAKHTSALLLQRTPVRAGTPAKTLALATFVPTLGQELCAGQQPQQNQEIWLVVDGSGSMEGAPIQQAMQAALFFVRDLPTNAGVKFNITAFGSSHKSLFGACQEYNATTESQAVQWIQKHVNADLGGTEILSCLQDIYSKPIAEGYKRSIVFLTDGGISGSEEQHVYDLVSGKSGSATAGNTTVLSLGIGHGVHRALLDGMAERSTGVAQYVVDDENIAKKCAFLKKCALTQSMLLRPRISTPGAMVRSAPHMLPSCIFADEPLQVLLEVMHADESATVELTAELPARASASSGSNPKGPSKLTFALPLKPQPAAAEDSASGKGTSRTAYCGPAVAAEDGHALGVLHAMAYIGGLLSGKSPLHVQPDGKPVQPPPSEEVVKDSVVRLAVAEHLVTPHTSAVGVLLRRDPLDPSGVKRVDVPLQVPQGRSLWGTHDGARGRQAFAAPVHAYSCSVSSAPSPKMLCSAMPPPPPPPCSAAPRLSAATAIGGVLQSSIDSLLMRGEKLESLDAHTDSLAIEADRFRKSAKAVKSGGGMFGRLVGGLFGAGRSASPSPGNSASYAAAPAALHATTGPATPQAMQQQQQQPEELCDYEDDEDMGSGMDLFGASADDSAAECKKKQKPTAYLRDVDECEPLPSTEQAEHSAISPAEVEEQGVAAAADLSLSLSLSAPKPAASAKQLPPPQRHVQALSPEDALQYLNLTRTTQGYWKASQELLAKLGLPASGGVHDARPAGAGPGVAALTEDAWATVLVIVVLRKRMLQYKEVWSDMEAKALAWLASEWPCDGSCKSVGAVVLAAQKLLTA